MFYCNVNPFLSADINWKVISYGPYDRDLLLDLRHPRRLLLRHQPSPPDNQVLPYQVLQGHQPHVPCIRLLREHIQCRVRLLHEHEDGAVAVSNLFQLRGCNPVDSRSHHLEDSLQVALDSQPFIMYIELKEI